MSPQPEPVFYSNRAACYVSMEPPQHEKVVADCDEALKLDARYVKALNRRATALEALESYESALRGAYRAELGKTLSCIADASRRLHCHHHSEQIPERSCRPIGRARIRKAVEEKGS